jgi:hypothetical protein
MTTIFHSMDEIRQCLPETTDMIEREHRIQSINDPKFVIGGIMNMSTDEVTKDLVVFFDTGIDGHVLWVWAPLGNEDDDLGLDNSYIDEYYEISFAEAEKYCSEIFNQRIRKE